MATIRDIDILASLNVKPIKWECGARKPLWHPINHLLLQKHDTFR